MPVKIRKTKKGKHRVSTPGGAKAKGTTKAKAKRQANLLRGVEHGWEPTGKKERSKEMPERAPRRIPPRQPPRVRRLTTSATSTYKRRLRKRRKTK